MKPWQFCKVVMRLFLQALYRNQLIMHIHYTLYSITDICYSFHVRPTSFYRFIYFLYLFSLTFSSIIFIVELLNVMNTTVLMVFLELDICRIHPLPARSFKLSLYFPHAEKKELVRVKVVSQFTLY